MGIRNQLGMKPLKPYLPTQEQIAKAAAAIRATWSETEHRKRLTGPQAVPVLMEEIKVACQREERIESKRERY